MMNTLLMLSRFANKTFALWVIIAGILGFVFPDVFKPIGSWIAILLGVMMFGMGLTLTTADFREIFRRPKDVFVGILAQFLIMPLAAFVLCKAFALPPDLAVGLMLLGCVPGGTASNLVTFLARGDVALSVTITSCTTLLAPLVTPALSQQRAVSSSRLGSRSSLWWRCRMLSAWDSVSSPVVSLEWMSPNARRSALK